MTDRSATAALAGSLTVFDALEGRRVWLGATVTHKEVRRTSVQSLDPSGRRPPGEAITAEDYPALPSLRMMTNSFLAELMKHWPSPSER